jgi:hypothetical protein
MALETFPYEVIKSTPRFEVRKMGEYFVVKSSVDERMGYEGFNDCFRYISGENDSGQRFSMTAPVLNKLEDQSMKDTSFVLLHQDQFPNPKGNAHIEKVNSSLMVVLKFKGNISQGILSEKTQELKEIIQSLGYEIKDGPWLARYNPPFIPGFLKRNEMMMEVFDV